MVKHGNPPFLECSSRGDKRFSAFFARIKSRGNQNIESLYQGAKVFEGGYTNMDWKSAKGKKALNHDEVSAFYLQLWKEYIDENPHLIEVLKEASGLSDMFGSPGSNCQATSLWFLRNAAIEKEQSMSTEKIAYDPSVVVTSQPFVYPIIVVNPDLENSEAFREVINKPMLDLVSVAGEFCSAGADEKGYEESTPEKHEAFVAARDYPLGVVKAYVCGFIFSQDWKTVWLIKKDRPEWQAGKVNGIGGKVEAGESAHQAMVRECFEECGATTKIADWIVLEQFNHSNGVQVTFLACCLPKSSPSPRTKTSEAVGAYAWQMFMHYDWIRAEVIDNIPYLVNKAFSFFHAPEAKRMEMQNSQDIRNV